MESRSFAIP